MSRAQAVRAQAVRAGTVALILLALAAGMFTAGRLTAHRVTVRLPVVAVCPFDGGGEAVAGSVTRTDTGAWLCTEDGRIIRPAGKSAHLPAHVSGRPAATHH